MRSVLGTCAALLASPLIAFAAGKDSVDATALARACDASLSACVDACRAARPNGVSDTLKLSFCEDDCYSTHTRCKESIPYNLNSGAVDQRKQKVAPTGAQ
jgi:hypothetical protein